MWTYIASARRLPGLYIHLSSALRSYFWSQFLYYTHFSPCAVQWSSWLTHTRPNPPTVEVGQSFDVVEISSCWLILRKFIVIQELQADLARQQRVKINAAILEAKDQEERVKKARLAAPSLHSETERHPPSASQNAPMNQKLGRPERDQRPEQQTRDPWAEALEGSDEPRSWTPTARRR